MASFSAVFSLHFCICLWIVLISGLMAQIVQNVVNEAAAAARAAAEAARSMEAMMKLRDVKQVRWSGCLTHLDPMVVTWSKTRASGMSSHWRLDLG